MLIYFPHVLVRWKEREKENKNKERVSTTDKRFFSFFSV
jgi:hypothetical protein